MAGVEKILVDSGPLIALLVSRDQHHAWAHQQFERLAPPFLTCEAALSEAQFLVRRLGGNPLVVLDMVARGAVSVAFQVEDEIDRLRELQSAYRDVPMSLADACLVRMSELYSRCRLLTTDSDFRTYRRNGRQVIPSLLPNHD
ncbi:MAG: PIN domain-containing protein [Planctomycetales bacterium]|nr:PIN domain-containing protein [Planctomycetales bacterium]